MVEGERVGADEPHTRRRDLMPFGNEKNTQSGVWKRRVGGWVRVANLNDLVADDVAAGQGLLVAGEARDLGASKVLAVDRQEARFAQERQRQQRVNPTETKKKRPKQLEKGDKKKGKGEVCGSA